MFMAIVSIVCCVPAVTDVLAAHLDLLGALMIRIVCPIMMASFRDILTIRI